MSASRWTAMQRIARVTVGLTVLAVVGCGIALLAAWPRLFPDSLTRGHRAYARDDWGAAAQSAREVLKTRQGDPGALRLLARSSVRLGRDDTALGIYTRGLEESALQAEDYLLLGVALKRRGRDEGAMWAWNKALEAEPVPSQILDQLTRVFYEEAVQSATPENFRPHPLDATARAAEQLCQRPGWESRGDMMLGLVRGDNFDPKGAAEAFRRLLNRDANAAESNAQPLKLRKLFARTFLRVGRPAEARPHLESILARGPDQEASWLLSRVYLQSGAIVEAREALARAASYRDDNPLAAEPSPYVGEARCQSCHEAIFQDSLAHRHTQTYYRGAQLRELPRPDRALPDPTDPNVTHAIKEIDGTLWEETRVGGTVLRSLIEYAFGTSERYQTMVSRDARDEYRMARLSYFHAPEAQGWDRTFLGVEDQIQTEDLQGQTIGVQAGIASCLHCHITQPRAGRERTGPETADRAIGCERCHGPGGNHLAAVEAGFSDRAIVSPASASPQAVTQQLCNGCHILDQRYRFGDREKSGWVRSQGVGWTWSRCNTESGGSFGCVTCHNPHQGLRSTTRATYEAKCLACHSASPIQTSGVPARVTQVAIKRKPKVCPVDPARGCIKCHMPGVRMDSSHRELTDHYIRVPRSGTAQRGVANSKGTP